MESKAFGPLIENWNRHGIIGTRAKILSVLLIVLLFGYSLFFTAVHTVLKVLIFIIGCCALVFILSRPSK